jgi:uncharacterized membrane protein YhaH (DUF805 family)
MSQNGTDRMMTFGEAITTVFRNYAEFAGRARRPEFWWWVLFTTIVSAGLNAFSVVRIGDVATLGGLLSGLWGLAVLIPGLAVTVRRLRDAGYGWGNIFWVLLPVAGLIVLVVFLAQLSRGERPVAPSPIAQDHS